MSAGVIPPTDPRATKDKDKRLEQLKYLWDEYQYRHELCWNAVYKVTVGTVALSLVPYTGVHFAHFLNWIILIPPFLGTLFAGFGLGVVAVELVILSPVKNTYTSMQEQYVGEIPNDECSRKDLKKQFFRAECGKTLFRWFVTLLLGSLLLLSSVHCLYLWKHLDGLIAISEKASR